MAVQVLGKVAYFNKGAYNSQTNYEINDVVSYNGSSYVSLNDNNQGNLPTNTNYWSVVAEKGDKGDTGKPFVIEKTYSTIESMVADYDNMNVNDYVMIQGSIEEQENATLWTKREVEVSPYKWAYLADFSGASGITGATPNIHIGNVTEGNEPSVTRRSGSSNENPILDFVLKTGAKGDTGATGNGISSIEKTSTSGLVDTYTITFTNGTSTTIEVTNGRGIVSIAKTSSVDYVDTYTITYNDGTASTFEVTNSEVTEEEFDDVVDELNYLYDDLPKVEGEGTNLALNNTRKGKMSNVLRGNTSQNTTTGKNLLNPSVATSNCSVSGGLITITSDTTDVYIRGAYVYSEARKFLTLPSGNYYLKSTNPSVKVTFYGDNGSLDTTTNQPITLASETNFGGIRVRSSSSLQNVTFGIMLATTNDSFEPYTGGIASPNPDYPQDVDVVSGNNSIEICGKNLFDKDNANTFNGYLNVSNVITSGGTQTGIYISCKSNTTYTITKENTGENNRFCVFTTDVIPEVGITALNYVGTRVGTDNNAYYTITTPSNAKYLCVFMRTAATTPALQEIMNTIMIEEESTSTDYEEYNGNTYEINLGTMELCKIGDYQDYIAKSTGKNLFDKNTIGVINAYIANTGKITYSTSNRTIYTQLQPNTTYTLSFTKVDDNGNAVNFNTDDSAIGFYSSAPALNDTLTGITTFSSATNRLEYTFTTDSANTYIAIKLVNVTKASYDKTLNTIQIEKGSTATEYEPFGKDKWYKHSEIGKVVLDGSENWQRGSNATTRSVYTLDTFTDRLSSNNRDDFYSDNFSYLGNAQGTDLGYAMSFNSNQYSNYLYIQIPTDIVEPNNITAFKQWLSTHNTIVYYVLATPTNTEITDQTLIAQLDNFEKALSYNTQTNISQENNDLPFIISASAFMSLKYLFGNLETRVAELETSEPSEL